MPPTNESATSRMFGWPETVVMPFAPDEPGSAPRTPTAGVRALKSMLQRKTEPRFMVLVVAFKAEERTAKTPGRYSVMPVRVVALEKVCTGARVPLVLFGSKVKRVGDVNEVRSRSDEARTAMFSNETLDWKMTCGGVRGVRSLAFTVISAAPNTRRLQSIVF
jgi:hypothetical protein